MYLASARRDSRGEIQIGRTARRQSPYQLAHLANAYKEDNMDATTLLIILIIALLVGGGG